MSTSSQVKLRQAEDHLKHQSQQLSACRRLIDQREERLEEASKDLRRSKRENADLRSTVDGTQAEPGHMRYSSSSFNILTFFFTIVVTRCLKCVIYVDRSETGPPHEELETLLRKLVEAEIDGQAVAKQATALRETVGKVKKVRRLANYKLCQLSLKCFLLNNKKKKSLCVLRTKNSRRRTLISWVVNMSC